MMDDEMDGLLSFTRRSRSVVVEGKSFDFHLQDGGNGIEKLLVTEIGGKGTFKGSFSGEGGRWVGKLLCQISLEEDHEGLMFRSIDRTITANVRRNRFGAYLQVLLFSKSDKRNYSVLCFPSGKGKKGWSLLGATIRDMTDVNLATSRQSPTCSIQHNLPKLRNDVSYAEACAKSVKTHREQPRVSMHTHGGVKHASWWLTTVICTTNCVNPNWEWLEGKVKGLFEGATVKPQSEGGALVIMQSDECVRKILTLPPLVTWEGYFSFQKWNPEIGAVSNLSNEKEIWLSFLGVPLHLRTKEVIFSMAKQCGDVREVDVESPLLSMNSSCQAKIHTKYLGSIPRIISLKERGYVSAIWVEVDLAGIMGEMKAVSMESGWDPQKFELVKSVTTVNGLTSRQGSDLSRPPGFSGMARQPTLSTGMCCHDQQVTACKSDNSLSVARVDVTPMGISSNNQSPNPSNNSFAVLNTLGSEEVQGGPVIETSNSSGNCGSLAKEALIMPVTQSQRTHTGRASRRSRFRGVRIQSPWPMKPMWKQAQLKENPTILKRGQPDPIEKRKEAQEHYHDLSNGAESNVQSITQSHVTPKIGETVNRKEKVGENETQSIGLEVQISNEKDVQGEEPMLQDDQPNIEGSKEVVSEGCHQMGFIAESIYNGKTKADKENFVEFCVIPLAKELGMTTSLSKEGQKRMFNELAFSDL